jgi:hypothetical protein
VSEVLIAAIGVAETLTAGLLPAWHLARQSRHAAAAELMDAALSVYRQARSQQLAGVSTRVR